MEKQEIKVKIEQLAKEENVSFIQAASAFQSSAAILGDEKLIEIIAELKRESDEYKNLFK